MFNKPNNNSEWKIADQKFIHSDDIIFEDDINLEEEEPSPRV